MIISEKRYNNSEIAAGPIINVPCYKCNSTKVQLFDEATWHS